MNQPESYSGPTGPLPPQRTQPAVNAVGLAKLATKLMNREHHVTEAAPAPISDDDDYDVGPLPTAQPVKRIVHNDPSEPYLEPLRATPKPSEAPAVTLGQLRRRIAQEDAKPARRLVEESTHDMASAGLSMLRRMRR